MEDQIFTRKETAEIFKIKPRTLWHWEKKGWIKPCGYIATRPRYSLEEIQRAGKEVQTLKWNKNAKSV